MKMNISVCCEYLKLLLKKRRGGLFLFGKNYTIILLNRGKVSYFAQNPSHIIAKILLIFQRMIIVRGY